MSKKFRLMESQMLDDSHFPVIAILDSIKDIFFKKTIEGISQGRGFGVDYGACIFPNDLDEYELATRGRFEGVEFGLHNGEEVIIDYKTLYHYLKLICMSYLQDYPQDNNHIMSCLEAYIKHYKLI